MQISARVLTVPPTSAQPWEEPGVSEALDDCTHGAPRPRRPFTRHHLGPLGDVTVAASRRANHICGFADTILKRPRQQPGLCPPTSSPHAMVFVAESGFLGGSLPLLLGQLWRIPRLPQTPASLGVWFRPLGKKVRSHCPAGPGAVWGASCPASKLLPLFLLFPQDYFYPRYLGKFTSLLRSYHKRLEGVCVACQRQLGRLSTAAPGGEAV